MKFFAPIVVGFIALFSAQVDANGVCYDPDHVSSKNDATVQADMKTIAGAGFSSVRTYISKFGNTEMGPIIAAAGLTAVLGVPYPQSDYQEQMEAAIKAANAGGVSIIMVGNENLAGASSVPSGMIDVINQIKSRVSCKVGTVQRNTEVIGYQSISGWSELVSACDVLGVNLHPFFNPGTTADGAIDVVDKQWKTMMSSFGDKLLLTETGWPSSGSVSGNTGSLAGEQTFYSDYQQWSSALGEKFYFQFFDTPGKSSAYEQTFGLYTADSQPKFTMSQSPSTSTSQQQQQQQTPTPTTSAPTTAAPAPTTAAPTPEPTTATPQPTTATPTPAPETYQSSGSSEANTTSSSITSASGSDASTKQGSASLSGSDSDVKVSSSSSSKTSSSTEQEETKTDSKSDKTTSETTQSATSTVSSIGKSSESEQQQQTSSTGGDKTQSANTQSEGSNSTGVVGLAVGGGGCAMLVAFGFIYQARKRAQELEEEDKDVHFSTITPVENICSL
ncbi:putative beta-glucosidase btgE [Phytophthora citrophthora]|uniref:glucan endo-1,3-beta-D-glucosidase n=1 Tax=Phytophthora citrophthora TaxID=4793 RepID=A0AAD9G1B2_9STRA|nr:putative beta-glucosidase btgE [Phytophthora citrophthora]